MTLNLNIQSLSYTSSRVQLAFGTPNTSAGTAAAPREPEDRATLSNDALAPETPRGSASADPPAPGSPAAPADPVAAPERRPSRAERRADALFAALDADKDGSVTKEEFTSGAKALLGRDGGPRRAGDDDGEDRRVSRFERRLDRRLAKAFDKVDGDDDGTISEAEMTAAFEKIGARRGRRPGGPAVDQAPGSETQPSTSAPPVSIQVTFVSIAIQRYTAVQGPAPPEPASTTSGAKAA